MSCRAAGWVSLSTAVLLFLLTMSCQTAPAALTAGSPEEETSADLDSLQARLLEIRLVPDQAALQALRAELGRAAGRTGLSRGLRGRIGSLRAKAALLAGDTADARSSMEAAVALAPADEGIWPIRAALETDGATRLALLEEGIKKAESSYRLLCERGRELLRAGRYAEAAQDLDEGLRGLDPVYRRLYREDKDRAFALTRTVSEGGAPNAAVERTETLGGPLSMRFMVERAFSETLLLASLSPLPKPAVEQVLPAVKAAGLLLSGSA